MSIHVDLEDGIALYLQNSTKVSDEFGDRIGKEGNNFDLTTITKPFVLIQALSPNQAIHSLGDWGRDITFTIQISIFNETKMQQKTLYEGIVNALEDEFNIDIGGKIINIEVELNGYAGFDGKAPEGADKDLFKNMCALNGQVKLVKIKGTSEIAY